MAAPTPTFRSAPALSPPRAQVGVKTIKALAERMRGEGVQRAVMVTQANMTPFAKQCLSEMAPKYYIELFQEVRGGLCPLCGCGVRCKHIELSQEVRWLGG